MVDSNISMKNTCPDEIMKIAVLGNTGVRKHHTYKV